MVGRTEVRVLVGKTFLGKLQDRLGGARPSEIVKQALGVYDWMTSEVDRGRVVVSASSDGTDIHRLMVR